ncbi:MAG: asparagine synthase (glutamine-hydrolyzing) [Bacteroidetes bacterium]|nr:asparagine synthase (glutamine-hydrolyzing) [Bacteroidota bacterium]
MCGIAGIYFKQSLVPEMGMLQRMNIALSHRGPDAEGTFCDNHIGLAHRRLSIIDLSEAGRQPMFSADGNVVLIFNGEIYNFKEVKAKIDNYPFVTQTDSEVIIAAYLKWGNDCVQHFNGMFAFALWDKRTSKLLIARDRLGVKPLYYHQHNDTFLFASEVRSLLTTGLVPAKLNRLAVQDYFMYQSVNAPATILSNVFMLMPGHTIEITNGRIAISKNWDICENKSEAAVAHDYTTIKKNVNDLFFAAVRRRLISDVPFGAFLSGGIDSSAVVAAMSMVMNKPVKTFTITFNESEYNESHYAAIIAKKYKTDHHELRLRPEDFLHEIPRALKALDHPSGDGPNSYTVSKITRANGITMALSGLGGDEFFAGYPVFQRSLQLEKYKFLWKTPRFIRSRFAKLAASRKSGVAGEKLNNLLQLKDYNFAKAFAIGRQINTPQHIHSLLTNHDLDFDSVEAIVNNLNFRGDFPLLSKVSAAEASTYMQNVLLRDTDQMSMAVALEVRTPFLDYELIAYVMGIPDKYKIPVFPKKLLVESLGNLLPDEIVHRKKMGFVFPWQQWLRQDMKSMCQTAIENMAQRSLFNSTYLELMWMRFNAGDPTVRWLDIWLCVVLENWLQENNINE